MNDKDLLVVDTMEQYGGSFIIALANAARRADVHNLEKIKSTWRDRWDYYLELGIAIQKADRIERSLK